MAWTFTLRPAIREKFFVTVNRSNQKGVTNRRCEMQNWQPLGDASGGEARVRSNCKRAAATVTSPTRRGAIGAGVTTIQREPKLTVQRRVSSSGAPFCEM